MRDFVISVIIDYFATTYLVFPYLDKLKTNWLDNGYTIEQITKPYNICRAVSFLAVGLIIYFVIWIIKLIINKLNTYDYY